MGDEEKREDIDALLGGLEEAAPTKAEPPAEPSQPVDAAAGPPSLPKRTGPNEHNPKEYKGRTEFADLFAHDTAPQPALRGGPEEKVEYFREKLRRAEAQIGRFREAWEVRTTEMDALEGLHAQEHKRAEEVTKALAQMQAFVEQKKLEFEAYGKKVTQAFADKDAAEKEVRDALEEARIETFEARADAERLERELTAEAEQERAAAQALREQLEQAKAQCVELEGRLQSQGDAEAAIELRDSTIQKLKEALKSLKARYEAQAAELQQARSGMNAAPATSEHVETVRKALEVAIILIGELETNETTARDPDANDVVERLHKALDIARREAAQV